MPNLQVGGNNFSSVVCIEQNGSGTSASNDRGKVLGRFPTTDAWGRNKSVERALTPKGSACSSMSWTDGDRGSALSTPWGDRGSGGERGSGQKADRASWTESQRGRATVALDDEPEVGWTGSFNVAMCGVVLVNAILLAFELDYGPRHGAPLRRWVWWLLCEVLFFVIYSIELGVRMHMEAELWPRSCWNWLDLSMVAVAAAHIVTVVTCVAAPDVVESVPAWLKVIQTFRLLRVLKILRLLPGLYGIVRAFGRAMLHTMWILALLSLGLFAWGLTLTSLVGKNLALQSMDLGGSDVKDRFGSLPRSMYTLFELLTLEGWELVVGPLVREEPWIILIFGSYAAFFSYGLVNMIVATVVSKTLQSSKLRWVEEKDRELRLSQMRSDLRDAFLGISTFGKSKVRVATEPRSIDGFAVGWYASDITRRTLKKMSIALGLPVHLFRKLRNASGSVSTQDLVDGVLKLQSVLPIESDVLATNAQLRHLNRATRPEPPPERQPIASESKATATTEGLVRLLDELQSVAETLNAQRRIQKEFSRQLARLEVRVETSASKDLRSNGRSGSHPPRRGHRNDSHPPSQTETRAGLSSESTAPLRGVPSSAGSASSADTLA
mmetsp:Transcript_20871/g.48375  ORF Transcript_20871/g.48375 Transcript_20871/m.48375 type:complete len:610 (-) Transcript_20871:19-1848(-)